MEKKLSASDACIAGELAEPHMQQSRRNLKLLKREETRPVVAALMAQVCASGR